MNILALDQFPLFEGDSYILPHTRGKCAKREQIALVLAFPSPAGYMLTSL